VDTLLFLELDIPKVDGCEGSLKAIDEEDIEGRKKLKMDICLRSFCSRSFNSL
jgi:hypothetical protein